MARHLTGTGHRETPGRTTEISIDARVATFDASGPPWKTRTLVQ